MKTRLLFLAALAACAAWGQYTSGGTYPPTTGGNGAQVNSDWSAGSGLAQILNKPVLGTAASHPVADFQSPITGAPGTWPTFSTVATSGSYTDLLSKPTLGTAAAQNTSAFQAPITGAPGTWPTFATVATSGSYTDLLSKPTIPAAQVNSDWNAISGVAQISNKPALATVATSGSYSDLSSTPSIPVASSTNPAMNGAAAVGTGTTWARADHVHASDTSRVPTTTTVNGHALSGNVSVTTTDLSLNNVTNDAQTKAAVVPNTAPTTGQMLVGNAGGTAYAPQSMTGDCSFTSAGAIACGTKQSNAIVNVTPVSTVASSTSVQNLMTVAIPAGALNTAGRTLHVRAPASYTTGSGTSNGIQTWLARACSVSGCASGTVVNLVSIASATDVISTTNGRVEFEIWASTAATGASGNLEAHGHLGIVLATTATTPVTWYEDSLSAVSGSIDLTAAWFVQISVTMATNGSGTASSIATERQLIVEVQ